MITFISRCFLFYAMYGVLVRRSFWCFIIVVLLVWCPFVLHALGVTSILFLLNPFTVFFVMFFVLMIGMLPYIPKSPHTLTIVVFFIAMTALIYVWALYIATVVPIPVLP